jgi:hypothetical protein
MTLQYLRGPRLYNVGADANINEFSGYAYILIGATLWGVSSVVAKSLFNSSNVQEELAHMYLRLAMDTLLVRLFLL